MVRGVLLLALLAWAGGSVAGVTAFAQPRGLRNHNPGNLRVGGAHWVGQIGEDRGGYLIFAEDRYGLRAMAITLANYQRLHHIDTLRALVHRYAPAAGGNDESAYVADLSGVLGIAPDQPFSIAAVLPALMAAMIRHENGRMPYSTGALAEAAGAAEA